MSLRIVAAFLIAALLPGSAPVQGVFLPSNPSCLRGVNLEEASPTRAFLAAGLEEPGEVKGQIANPQIMVAQGWQALAEGRYEAGARAWRALMRSKEENQRLLLQRDLEERAKSLEQSFDSSRYEEFKGALSLLQRVLADPDFTSDRGSGLQAEWLSFLRMMLKKDRQISLFGVGLNGPLSIPEQEIAAAPDRTSIPDEVRSEDTAGAALLVREMSVMEYLNTELSAPEERFNYLRGEFAPHFSRGISAEWPSADGQIQRAIRSELERILSEHFNDSVRLDEKLRMESLALRGAHFKPSPSEISERLREMELQRNRLSYLREAAGFRTCVTLAEAAGVLPASIQPFEAGSRGMGLPVRRRVADVLERELGFPLTLTFEVFEQDGFFQRLNELPSGQARLDLLQEGLLGWTDRETIRRANLVAVRQRARLLFTEEFLRLFDRRLPRIRRLVRDAVENGLQERGVIVYLDGFLRVRKSSVRDLLKGLKTPNERLVFLVGDELVLGLNELSRLAGTRRGASWERIVAYLDSPSGERLRQFLGKQMAARGEELVLDSALLPAQAGLEEGDQGEEGMTRRDLMRRTGVGILSTATGRWNFLAEELVRLGAAPAESDSSAAQTVLSFVGWLGFVNENRLPEFMKKPKADLAEWERIYGDRIYRDAHKKQGFTIQGYPDHVAQNFLALAKSEVSLLKEWIAAFDKESPAENLPDVPSSVLSFYWVRSPSAILKTPPASAVPMAELLDFWESSTQEWLEDSQEIETMSKDIPLAKQRLEGLRQFRQVSAESQRRFLLAALRARLRFLENLLAQAEPLVAQWAQRMGGPWIRKQTSFDRQIRQTVSQMGRKLQSVRPSVSPGAIFVGLINPRAAGQFGEFLDDWGLLRQLQRSQDWDVVLLREELSRDQDPVARAMAISGHVAESDFRGNLGIALPILSWNGHGQQLLALEYLAEELMSRHPGFRVSFIVTFEERLMGRAPHQRIFPAPSLSQAFVPWFTDPVLGVMPVQPGLRLPPAHWDRFQDYFWSQAGLEQEA